MTDLLWYTSVGGIVVASIFFVNVAKRLLGDVAFLRRFPTWCYVVLVAAIATEAFHLAGMLPGSDLALLTQSVGLAAMSSGFREWYANAGKPLSASTAAREARGETL